MHLFTNEKVQKKYATGCSFWVKVAAIAYLMVSVSTVKELVGSTARVTEVAAVYQHAQEHTILLKTDDSTKSNVPAILLSYREKQYLGAG